MTTSKKASIQENINQLDELLKYFEEDNKQFNLDDALEKYETAMKIVASVSKELESFELKITEIKNKYASSVKEPSAEELDLTQ